MSGRYHDWRFSTYLGCPEPEDQRDHPSAHSSRLSRFDTHEAALHDGHTWLEKGRKFRVRQDERGYFWCTMKDTWLLAIQYLSQTYHKARGSEFGDCAADEMALSAGPGGTRQVRAVLQSESLSG